jgi:hypothetical protein
MVPNRGLEAVVQGRHDPNLVGVGNEQKARRRRPLEAKHGTVEVLRQLDHVDHVEPKHGTDIDNARKHRRDVFAIWTWQ